MMVRFSARHSTAGSSPGAPAGCLPDEAATTSAAGVPLSFPAAAPEDRLLTEGEITFHSLWRVLNIYRRFRCSSSSAQQNPPAEHLPPHDDPLSEQRETTSQRVQPQRMKEEAIPTEENKRKDAVPLSSSEQRDSPDPSLSFQNTLDTQFSPRLQWDVPDGSVLLPVIPASPEAEQQRKLYVQLHEVLMGLPPPILVSQRPPPNALPLDALLYSPPHNQSHLSFPRGQGKPPLPLRQLFLHVPLSRREQTWLEALHSQLARLFRPIPSCSLFAPAAPPAVFLSSAAADAGAAAAAASSPLPEDSTQPSPAKREDPRVQAAASDTAPSADEAARDVTDHRAAQQQQEKLPLGLLRSSSKDAGGDGKEEGGRDATTEPGVSVERRRLKKTSETDEAGAAAAGGTGDSQRAERREDKDAAGREGTKKEGAATEGASAAAKEVAGEASQGQEKNTFSSEENRRRVVLKENGGGATSPRTDTCSAISRKISSDVSGFFSGGGGGALSRESSSTETLFLDRGLLFQLEGDDDDETVESLLQARAAEDAHFAALAAGCGDTSFGEAGSSKRLEKGASHHGSGVLHYRSRHCSSKRGETNPTHVLQPYPQVLEPALLRVLWLMYRSSPRQFPPPAAPPWTREEKMQQKLQKQQFGARRASSSFLRRRSDRRSKKRSSSRSTSFRRRRRSSSSKESSSCSPVASPVRPAASAEAGDAASVGEDEQRSVGLLHQETGVSFSSAAARSLSGEGTKRETLPHHTGAAAAEGKEEEPCVLPASGASIFAAAGGMLRGSSSAEDLVDDCGRYLDTCMTAEEEVAEAEGLAVEAAAHLMKMVSFRREIFPLSDSSAELGSDLSKGILYWTGRDVALRPVLILNLRRLDTGLTDLPRFLRLLLFVFEWGLRFMMVPGKVETCVVIFDVREVSLWALPYKCLQMLVQTLTLQYPFRLRKMFVLHNSRLINGLWNIVKVFLTDVQQSKIASFKVERSSGTSELFAQVHALVPPSQLEEKYGGSRENIKEGFYPFPIAPAQPLPKKDICGKVTQRVRLPEKQEKQSHHHHNDHHDSCTDCVVVE